jgi:hypothetical protein
MIRMSQLHFPFSTPTPIPFSLPLPPDVSEGRDAKTPSIPIDDVREAVTPSESPVERLTTSTSQSAQGSVQVILRIRPPRVEGPMCLEVTNEAGVPTSRVILKAPAGVNADRSGEYSFSRVLGPDVDQVACFDATTRPLVEDLVTHAGRHAVLFTYGITASGKTHTVTGTPGAPGLIPRALGLLFDKIADAEPESSDDLRVVISQYEVYNEKLFDLLAPAPHRGPKISRASLRVKEDINGRVYVEGLSEELVGSAAEAIERVAMGTANRSQAGTLLNAASSRSHMVFTITLMSTSGERLSKLSLVDLAGSERINRTQNTGARLQEAIRINSSLSTLGRCLKALRDHQTAASLARERGRPPPRLNVPYRESTITKLFRDALHGLGRITLVTCASPSPLEFLETSHVLQYAALASQILVLPEADRIPLPDKQDVCDGVPRSRLDSPPRLRSGRFMIPGSMANHVRELATAQRATVRAVSRSRIAALEQELEQLRSERVDLQRAADDAHEVCQDARLMAANAHRELAQSRANSAAIEARIRAEVGKEMEGMLTEMEVDFRSRLERRMKQIESDFGIDLGLREVAQKVVESCAPVRPTWLDLSGRVSDLEYENHNLRATNNELHQELEFIKRDNDAIVEQGILSEQLLQQICSERDILRAQFERQEQQRTGVANVLDTNMGIQVAAVEAPHEKVADVALQTEATRTCIQLLIHVYQPVESPGEDRFVSVSSQTDVPPKTIHANSVSDSPFIYTDEGIQVIRSPPKRPADDTDRILLHVVRGMGGLPTVTANRWWSKIARIAFNKSGSYGSTVLKPRFALLNKEKGSPEEKEVFGIKEEGPDKRIERLCREFLQTTGKPSMESPEIVPSPKRRKKITPRENQISESDPVPVTPSVRRRKLGPRTPMRNHNSMESEPSNYAQFRKLRRLPPTFFSEHSGLTKDQLLLAKNVNANPSPRKSNTPVSCLR